MKPFPLASDLPRFVGDAVAQVWLDPWAIRFVFESGVQLYAEQCIEHLEPNGTAWTYDCQAEDRSPLVLYRLLYKRIVTVDREETRLTFGIEDGAALVIFSQLGPYESGHILTSAGDITVF